MTNLDHQPNNAKSPNPTRTQTRLQTAEVELWVHNYSKLTNANRIDQLLPQVEAKSLAMSSPPPAAAAAMAVDDADDDQLASMSTEDIVRATRLLDNETRVLKVCSLSLSPPPRETLGFAPAISSMGFGLICGGLSHRVPQDELQRTNLEVESYKEKIKENQEKIKLNKQLPYLVGNIVEVCARTTLTGLPVKFHVQFKAQVVLMCGDRFWTSIWKIGA